MRISPVDIANKDFERMRVMKEFRVMNDFKDLTLLENLSYDNKRFEEMILEKLYNQRAFIESLKAKGSRIDTYL